MFSTKKEDGDGGDWKEKNERKILRKILGLIRVNGEYKLRNNKIYTKEVEKISTIFKMKRLIFCHIKLRMISDETRGQFWKKKNQFKVVKEDMGKGNIKIKGVKTQEIIAIW